MLDYFIHFFRTKISRIPFVLSLKYYLDKVLLISSFCMKKRFLLPLIFLVLLIGGGLFIGKYLLNASKNGLNAISLVPDDAIFIIETNEPIQNWKDISSSKPWQFLKGNQTFNEITSGADYLDSLINENSAIFGGLGSRHVLLSAHLYTPDAYDFLYIVDLENISKINGLITKTLQSIEGYRVTETSIEGQVILELYDLQTDESLYLTYVDNLLLCSYQKSIVEKAIAQQDEPKLSKDDQFLEVENVVRDDDMFRVYIQYTYFDNYLATFMTGQNEYLTALSTSMAFTGLGFDYDQDQTILEFKGLSNLDTLSDSYLHLLCRSKPSTYTFDEVVPATVASVISIGVTDFTEFYDSFMGSMKDQPDELEYLDNLTKIERFLKIDLRENFVKWIGPEITFVQTQPVGLGKENEFALFLKTTEIDDAKENLDFIGKQIKKRTPVKFKGLAYNGHEIKFLSVKGVFKLMMGDFFENIEKPYYTYLDDYVVFSNHPQTLKNLIDDYESGQVLANNESFEEFSKQLEPKSTLMIYINSAVAQTSFSNYLDSESKMDLDKNKKYFEAFPHVAFQLKSNGQNGFITHLVMDYLEQEELEDLKENIEEEKEEKQQSADKFSISLNNQKISLKEVEKTALIQIDEIVVHDLDAKLQTGNYPSGNLKFEVGIKDGKKHGNYREYSQNGDLMIKGQYRSGKQYKTWRYYNEHGDLIKRKRY